MKGPDLGAMLVREEQTVDDLAVKLLAQVRPDCRVAATGLLRELRIHAFAAGVITADKARPRSH